MFDALRPLTAKTSPLIISSAEAHETSGRNTTRPWPTRQKENYHQFSNHYTDVVTAKYYKIQFQYVLLSTFCMICYYSIKKNCIYIALHWSVFVNSHENLHILNVIIVVFLSTQTVKLAGVISASLVWSELDVFIFLKNLIQLTIKIFWWCYFKKLLLHYFTTWDKG